MSKPAVQPSDPVIDLDADYEPMIRRLFWPVIAGAIVAFPLLTPLLEIAQPTELGGLGMVLGGSIMGFGISLRLRRGLVRGWLIGTTLFGMLASAVLIGVIFNDVTQKEEVRTKRCRMLELDMLQVEPSRSDATDLFEALKCRPQTNMPVERDALSDAMKNAPAPGGAPAGG